MEDVSALLVIPKSKIESILKKIDESNIENKQIYKKLYYSFYEANIPVDYWNTGYSESDTSNISKLYFEYTKELTINYNNGKSLLIASGNGVGKTYCLTNILKFAIKKNYKCLYTNLFDVVSVLTSAPNSEKFIARQLLLMVDLLAIEEFDDRYIISNSASDLYTSLLETIIRTRLQNKLPTFISTNSPNILKSLSGPLKTSLESLFSKIETHLFFGEDLRIKNVK